MEIYVLIDAKTGKFWQKQSYDNRRGIYAFKSEAKALATLKQYHPRPKEGEVLVKKFENNETQPNNP